MILTVGSQTTAGSPARRRTTPRDAYQANASEKRVAWIRSQSVRRACGAAMQQSAQPTHDGTCADRSTAQTGAGLARIGFGATCWGWPRADALTPGRSAGPPLRCPCLC
eukprot:359590-Chlamydomonas_euryale.AAC.12